MSFAHPAALLLLVTIVPVVLAHRRSKASTSPGRRRVATLLTCGAIVALTFAAADPRIVGTPSVARTVIVAGAADASVADTVAAWRDATPWSDPWRVLRAGAVPTVGPLTVSEIPASSGEPDLSRAILAAVARAPADGPLEIAVLGESGDTGAPLAPLAELLGRRGARLHVRTRPPVKSDAILAVDAPGHVRIAEPFDCLVRVRLASAATVRLVVKEGDREVGAATHAAPQGTTTLPVTVRPQGRGAVVFDVVASVNDASSPALAERLGVLVDGTIDVALASGADAAHDALAATLGPGFSVRTLDLATPPTRRPDVVILDDVPARSPSAAVVDAVRSAVVDGGTGLLVSGANASFGPGGYADTPLGDLLPVTFPQEEERRDPSVGLVIVIDTSGSMSGTRIDLAKEVARLAIKRLLPHDKVGMVEFYGSRRWAAPLQTAANAIEIQRALNRLQAGGGTIIYEALEESYYALLEARTRFRHALVITDGGVESGPFEALARRMADSGILVHTVLVGPGGNSPFLQDLSRWGRGRFYACPNRHRLPDLSFREPQASPRPAVESGALPVVRSTASETTAAIGDASVSIALSGAATLRPGADLLLAVKSERPLLASWDQGRGRAAALATELLGPGVAPWRADPTHPTLLIDLVRALSRGTTAEAATLRVTPRRGSVWIEADGFTAAPRIDAGAFSERAVPRGDGGFIAAIPASETPVVVEARDGDTTARAVALRPNPRDGRLDDAGPALSALATLTGGTTDGPLPTTMPAPDAPRSRRTPAALLGMTLFLLALLVRRWPERIRTALPLVAIWLAIGGDLVAQTPTSKPDPVVLALDRGALTSDQRLASLTDDVARLAYFDAMGEVEPARTLAENLLARTDLDDAVRFDVELRLALLDGAKATPRATARLAGLDAAGAPAILRRALAVERTGDPRAAADAWEKAAGELPLARDRRFAWARFLTSMRRAGALGDVRDRLAPKATDDVHARRTMLQALRETGAADAALALATSGDGALSDEALAVAVETGRADLAIATARTLLEKTPKDLATRTLLARTLAEQQDRAAADRVLGEGIPIATDNGTLLFLFARADEWKLERSRDDALKALRARGPEGTLEAALAESRTLLEAGKIDAAKSPLVAMVTEVKDAPSRARLAEAFEAVGSNTEAIALWREAWDATKAEDAGTRLATLLEATGKPEDAEAAVALWKTLWQRAGSAARRTQAQERVLDGAARNGTLADIALELEDALAADATPDRDMVLDALLALYARAKDSAGGLAAIATWEARTGKRVDALERRAMLHQLCDEPVAHEKVLKELIAVDPAREIEWRRMIALSLLDRGRAVMARAAVTDLLERPDRTEETDEFAAGILRFIGRPEEAAAAYVSGLRLHPDRIETLLLLADAWKASGSTERGIVLFKDILAFDGPDDLLVLAADGLLNLEADSKALQAATRAVQRRIATYPGRVHLLRVLQDLFEALKDDAARLKALEETVVVAGDQRPAFVRELAEERLRANDRRGGADVAREFLMLGVEAPPALFLTLGEALLKDGDRRGAEAAFAKTAIGLDGAANEAKIAKLYEDAGAWSDAERVRRRQLLRAPDDVDAALALAKTLEKQKRFDVAAPLYVSVCLRRLEKETTVAEESAASGVAAGSARAISIVGRSLREGAATDEILAAVLRMKPDAATVAPIIDPLEAATRRGTPAAKNAALRRLATFLHGLGTPEATGRLRAREDAMLADCAKNAATGSRPSQDTALIRAVGESRLAHGDLEGAFAAAAILNPAAFDRFAFRLNLIAGKDADAEAMLARATDADLAWGVGLLAALKGPEIARVRLADLRDAAVRRPIALADDYVTLASGLDPTFDRRAFEEAGLKTLIAEWKPGVASLQLLTYMESRPDLPTALKASALKLVAQDGSTVARSTTTRLVAAGRGILPDADLGPVVEKLVKEATSPYLAADRLKDVGLVDAARRESLLDETLRKFRNNDANQIPLALLSESRRPLPKEILGKLVDAFDPKAIDMGDVAILKRLGKAPHLPEDVRTKLMARILEARRDDPMLVLAMAQLVPDAAERERLAKAAMDGAIRKGDVNGIVVVGTTALGLVGKDTLEGYAALPADATAGTALAKGLAQGRLGDTDAFAAALSAAARSRPDDVGLLRQAVEALKTRGRPADAAALLVNYLENGSKAFPYWIGEAATLLVDIGRPDDAAAALRRPMEGYFVTTLETLRLKIAVLTSNPEIRDEMIREAIAAIAPSSSGIRFVTRTTGRAPTLADALRPLAPRRPLPVDRDDALGLGDGSALGFVVDGDTSAQRILAALPVESRADRVDLLKAIVIAARREGRLDAIVRATTDGLRSAPADTSRLALLVYAKIAGATVEGDPMDAWARRLLTATVAPPTLLDAAEAAIALGRRDLTSALVNRINAARAMAGGDEELRRLVLLAALAPGNLPSAPELRGDSEWIGVSKEGPTLAALAASGRTPRDVVAAWKPAWERLRNAAFVWEVRNFTLPWAGWCLRAGDTATAKEALTMFDDEDATPPAWAFAAAMPPLSEWSDPAAPADVAAFLLGRIRTEDASRRSDLIRLAMVLVRRFEAAGRAAEGEALRRDLKSVADGVRLGTFTP